MTSALTFSTDQQEALDAILDFWQKERRQLTLGGYAGVGKTTIVAEAVRILRGRSRKKWRHKDAKMAFACYTGKAADVLRRKLEAAGAVRGDDYRGTIHGLIYEPRFDKHSHIIGWDRRKELDYDLIVVDEASMVDDEIENDLSSYGVPILYVGDHGQLPPINGRRNLMSNPEVRLEKIHRQAADNPIIKLSMMAREGGHIPVGKHGEWVSKVSDQNIVDRIEKPEDAMILCGWNNFRVEMNRKIRALLGIVDPSPVIGDRVICLRNNKEQEIYNGMTGTITRIEDGNQHAWWMEITLDGVEIPFRGLVSRHQFGVPSTLKNAPGWTYDEPVELFDYGYAMTVHKAQGSEHSRVVLFEQRFAAMDDDLWRRWLYTGITRSRERLLIVGY